MIINEGKVSCREAAMLVVVTILTELFLTFMAELAEKGQSATWIILLVATVIGLLFFLPLATLMEKYPGDSLIEVTEKLLGTVFGGLFSLIYLIYFLVTPAVILRQYAERVLTVSIPELPISMAMGFMLLGALVGCYLGLEAMARSALFIIYFVGFTIILVNILAFPYWRFDYLFPLAGPGVIKILKEGFLKTSIMGEVLLLAIIFPSLKDSSIKNAGLGAISVSGMTLIFSMIILQLTFGVAVLQEMSLPSFELSRLIYFGRFLQRLESIFMPIWALVGMMKVAISCYIGGVIVTRFLKLPYHQPFFLPVAIIIFSLAFIPANISQTLWVDFNAIGTYSWVVTFFLPALLLMVTRIRERGKGNAA